jgi:hypothetical protein
MIILANFQKKIEKLDDIHISRIGSTPEKVMSFFFRPKPE